MVIKQEKTQLSKRAEVIKDISCTVLGPGGEKLLFEAIKDSKYLSDLDAAVKSLDRYSDQDLKYNPYKKFLDAFDGKEITGAKAKHLINWYDNYTSITPTGWRKFTQLYSSTEIFWNIEEKTITSEERPGKQVRLTRRTANQPHLKLTGATKAFVQVIYNYLTIGTTDWTNFIDILVKECLRDIQNSVKKQLLFDNDVTFLKAVRAIPRYKKNQNNFPIQPVSLFSELEIRTFFTDLFDERSHYSKIWHGNLIEDLIDGNKDFLKGTFSCTDKDADLLLEVFNKVTDERELDWVLRDIVNTTELVSNSYLNRKNNSSEYYRAKLFDELGSVVDLTDASDVINYLSKRYQETPDNVFGTLDSIKKCFGIEFRPETEPTMDLTNVKPIIDDFIKDLSSEVTKNEKDLNLYSGLFSLTNSYDYPLTFKMKEYNNALKKRVNILDIPQLLYKSSNCDEQEQKIAELFARVMQITFLRRGNLTAFNSEKDYILTAYKTTLVLGSLNLDKLKSFESFLTKVGKLLPEDKRQIALDLLASERTFRGSNSNKSPNEISDVLLELNKNDWMYCGFKVIPFVSGTTSSSGNDVEIASDLFEQLGLDPELIEVKEHQDSREDKFLSRNSIYLNGLKLLQK